MMMIQDSTERHTQREPATHYNCLCTQVVIPVSECLGLGVGWYGTLQRSLDDDMDWTFCMCITDTAASQRLEI